MGNDAGPSLTQRGGGGEDGSVSSLRTVSQAAHRSPCERLNDTLAMLTRPTGRWKSPSRWRPLSDRNQSPSGAKGGKLLRLHHNSLLLMLCGAPGGPSSAAQHLNAP